MNYSSILVAFFVIIIGMASTDATYSEEQTVIRDSRQSTETTLIVLAAPSVKSQYYKAVFSQIIDYMADFANVVHDTEDVVILVDAITRPYFTDKVPENILIEANIEDIWIRDFAPVIPSRQIKFQYLPRYHRKSLANLFENSFEKWLSDNDLHYGTKSNLILDGGNVVDCPDGSKIVITERILADNPQLTKAEAKAQLKQIMNVAQVAIIQELEGDTTGHSDGMVMWVSNNKLLVNKVSEPWRTEILNELEASFPDVTIVEVPDYYKHSVWKGFTSACNVYVNSVVTDDFIYMPIFDSPHDTFMQNLIQSHTQKKVLPIIASNVCYMGGSVRCLTWQVKGELKNKILKLRKRQQDEDDEYET